jgi:tRNA A-37 threonylcarbamoyl transferase component Bud32
VTTRGVWLDGRAIKLAASALVGQGGEAEIYDLADGRVLKWWKPADHPDYQNDQVSADAATRRIAEHQRKLRAFPAGLPAAVIAPGSLATAKKTSTTVVGFAMRKVAGEVLHAFGEVKWRRDRGVALDTVVAALRDLHATVGALHAAGVVIGDFNDLNVLVDGPRAYVIDTDSFQLPGFPSALFSHRFVDPRLCDPAWAAPALIKPHDPGSDWFAFAVMAFRSLLGVSPYGGVHRPADPRRAVAAAARSLRGISVFDPDVVYPRAALPWSVLPDDVVDAFHRVFVGGARGVFPRRALDGLRFQRCTSCATEHARGRCPVCTTHVSVPIAVNGALKVLDIAPSAIAPTTWEVGAAPAPGAPAVWIAGGALYRKAALGDDRIGDVLAGQTRAWVGARFGVGFYRAGGLTVGFVFRPDRRGVDDRVALPPIRGALVRAAAAIADTRAWLSWVTAFRGALTTTVVAIGADGRIAGTHTGDGDDWVAGIAGAVAAGDALFVPTDDGVVRVQADAGALVVVRAFPDTRVAVAAGDALHLGPSGLDVLRGGRARRLHLS